MGRNLRGGDAPHRALGLPQAVRRRLTPAVLNLRSADDRRVAAALSYGQVMVFASVYDALLQRKELAGLPDPVAAPDVEPLIDASNLAVEAAAVEPRRHRGRLRGGDRHRAPRGGTRRSDGAQDGAPVRTAARRDGRGRLGRRVGLLRAGPRRPRRPGRAPRRSSATPSGSTSAHERSPKEPRMRTSVAWRTSSSKPTCGSPPSSR